MSKLTPFDFINSVTYDKTNLINDFADEKKYVPYIVNRGLSFGADTIIYANEMNSRPHIQSKLQYDFLLNSIPKKKRYNKWIKADENENVELIVKYYGYSYQKAKQVVGILTEDQLKQIKQRTYTGGKT